MAKHLQKDAGGHLIKVSHLVNDCGGSAASSDCTDCKTDCDDGSSSITMVVSGITGSSACTDMNGTYTLSWHGAGHCHWEGNNGAGALGWVKCVSNVWEVKVTGVSVQECFNNAAPLICSGNYPTGTITFTTCTACGGGGSATATLS